MPAPIPVKDSQFPQTMSLSTDGKILAIGWSQNNVDATDTLGVSVIDTVAGKVLWTLPRKPKGFDRLVAVTPDAKSVAVVEVGGKPIEFYDVATKRVTKTVPIKVGPIESSSMSLEFSADGKWLIAGTTEGPTLIQPATGRVVGPLGFSTENNAGAGAQHVAISPDGKVLAASQTGMIRVWDVSTVTKGK
jgi:WD40 repeat protein